MYLGSQRQVLFLILITRYTYKALRLDGHRSYCIAMCRLVFSTVRLTTFLSICDMELPSLLFIFAIHSTLFQPSSSVVDF